MEIKFNILLKMQMRLYLMFRTWSLYFRIFISFLISLLSKHEITSKRSEVKVLGGGGSGRGDWLPQCWLLIKVKPKWPMEYKPALIDSLTRGLAKVLVSTFLLFSVLPSRKYKSIQTNEFELNDIEPWITSRQSNLQDKFISDFTIMSEV